MVGDGISISSNVYSAGIDQERRDLIYCTQFQHERIFQVNGPLVN